MLSHTIKVRENRQKMIQRQRKRLRVTDSTCRRGDRDTIQNSLPLKTAVITITISFLVRITWQLGLRGFGATPS
jgi:hypothetical protein